MVNFLNGMQYAAHTYSLFPFFAYKIKGRGSKRRKVRKLTLVNLVVIRENGGFSDKNTTQCLGSSVKWTASPNSITAISILEDH